MKILIRAHVVTSIVVWILVAIAAPMVIAEGGLAAFSSLCILGVATAITIVDILSSVYFAKKGRKSFLPIISAMYWGYAFFAFGTGMFSPEVPWQGRVFMGGVVLVALFKLIVSISLFQAKKINRNSQLI